MFFGADEWSDMKLTDSVPFPDLSETWKEATTDVQVTAKVINGTGSKLHQDGDKKLESNFAIYGCCSLKYRSRTIEVQDLYRVRQRNASQEMERN